MFITLILSIISKTYELNTYVYFPFYITSN